MADSFSVEEIPDPATLLFRVQQMHIAEDGRITSACFGRDQMSVNWEKYSTPEETAQQAPKQDTGYVVGLVASFCRALSQRVIHKPLSVTDPNGPNRAHAEVQGRKNGSIKAKLRDHAAQQILWSQPRRF